MPIDFNKCVIKSIFSLKLSQRFNTFNVNKIFKYVCIFKYISTVCVSNVFLKLIRLPCVTSHSNAIVGEIKMPDNTNRCIIMPLF